MPGFISEETVRETLSGMLDDGERLDSVARGVDLHGHHYYLGHTDRRALVVRFNKSFAVKSRKTIPYEQLEEKMNSLSLLDGLVMAPLDRPVLRTDRERDLYELARKTVTALLEDGERLITLGCCRDSSLLLALHYYVVFTDRRLLIVSLSKVREVEGVDSVPLQDIEEYTLKIGKREIPIDTPLFVSQSAVLSIKHKSGRSRELLVTDLFGGRADDVAG